MLRRNETETAPENAEVSALEAHSLPARRPSGASHSRELIEIVRVAPQRGRDCPRKCGGQALDAHFCPSTAHRSPIEAQEPVIVLQPVGHELAGKGPGDRRLRCDEIPDNLVS